MEVQFTRHAADVVSERRVEDERLQLTVESPDRRLDPSDGTVHYLKKIAAFGDRWLRVVINPATQPPTVVTVFFDRRLS